MVYNCFECIKEFGDSIPSSVIMPDFMVIREVCVNMDMIYLVVFVLRMVIIRV